MKLQYENYIKQIIKWPNKGKHILAQYDSESIIVYQAYNSTIGNFAVDNNYFEKGFSFSRMSWIKPNFLWMMYRSGWAQKENQNIILAVRLKRSFFDALLQSAVHSTYKENIYCTNKNWKQSINNSEVRLQWDPDHDPYGNKMARKAIQLGMKGATLKEYSKNAILEIINITEFVTFQYNHITNNTINELITPEEKIYKIKNKEIINQIELTS